MKKTITLKTYNELSDGDKLWYAPLYKKYSVRKFRKYETCDLGHSHFMRWEEERTPAGEPYKYNIVTVFEHNLAVVYELTRPMVIDKLNNSNVLMERVLYGSGIKKVKWDK